MILVIKYEFGISQMFYILLRVCDCEDTETVKSSCTKHIKTIENFLVVLCSLYDVMINNLLHEFPFKLLVSIFQETYRWLVNLSFYCIIDDEQIRNCSTFLRSIVTITGQSKSFPIDLLLTSFITLVLISI